MTREYRYYYVKEEVPVNLPKAGMVDGYFFRCVCLEKTLYENNGTHVLLNLAKLEDVQRDKPQTAVRISRVFYEAARQGFFKEINLELYPNSDEGASPEYGSKYRTSLVYNANLTNEALKNKLKNHGFTLGDPARSYAIRAGSVVEKKRKKTTNTIL